MTEQPPAGPTPVRAERGWSKHLCWLLCSLTLLSVFPYYEQINNPNENARIWMVRAIVDFHELQLNRVGREWGYVNDKAIVDGRLYSGKAPGASFVGVPIYFVARQIARMTGAAPLSKRTLTLVLRFFGVAVPMAAFLYFFARWVEQTTGSASARDLLVVGLGLGTMLYPYGVIFVGHALAAALAFSGFMLLEREPAGGARRSRLAWAGALVGVSVLFEYQVLFAAIALTGYAIARHRKGVLPFTLGAVPPAVALGAYHTVLFGRPWETSLNHLENPTFASWHNKAPFLGFHLPSGQALVAVLFSPSLGLFVFSSFLLLGFGAAAWLSVRGRKAEGLTILAVTAAMIFFLSGVPNWHAGWCVGPRYIAVVAPFLAGALALAWRQAKGQFALSLVVTGLVIPSVFLNVISGALYPHYPEVFDNPVFDLAVPLVSDGYRPYGLGWLLGLPRAWAMLPVALLVAIALARALRGPDRSARGRSIHALGALVIAALALVPLARYGRQQSPDEAASSAFVRATWAPRP